jgi:hypothetical protein
MELAVATMEPDSLYYFTPHDEISRLIGNLVTPIFWNMNPLPTQGIVFGV